MNRLLIALAAMGLSCIAMAQTAQMPNPDQVTDMLAAKLTLSDDQKTQIKPIIADRQQKMAVLRADDSMRKGKKFREMKGVLDDSDRKINALLNDQQKQQYAQIEQQMREQIRERMKEQKSAGAAQ
jgi:protein CpxP